ncbi:MAG: hypothetical protein ACRD1R_09705 [Acidobacteriota bacterium]
MRKKALSFLSLFASLGTLICCALPILLVSLGMGMAVAGLVSSVPWLVTLSQHKGWVFSGSGLMIGLTIFFVYGLPRLRQNAAECHAGDGDACAVANRFTRVMLWFSVAIYLVGFFTAYLYLPIWLYLTS